MTEDIQNINIEEKPFENLDENGKKKKTTKTHIDYYKNFKDKHKDDINKKICCEICGGSYSYYNKSGHLKTKKCQTVKNLRNL